MCIYILKNFLNICIGYFKNKLPCFLLAIGCAVISSSSSEKNMSSWSAKTNYWYEEGIIFYFVILYIKNSNVLFTA